MSLLQLTLDVVIRLLEDGLRGQLNLMGEDIPSGGGPVSCEAIVSGYPFS